MKIIALLPFKDEESMLPVYLSSVTPIVDEILAVDDGSTDRSRQLVEEAGGYVVDNTATVASGWAEHSIRERLLHLGRDRGGTHFIALDADEALTAPCRTHLKEALASLAPGQKLAMQWLTLWKSSREYRDDDSVWGNRFKDFAFADPGGTGHDQAFLGVARTAGLNTETTWVRLPVERGAVLHYQFVPWWRSQVKQAWYRCAELIRAPDRAYYINRMYDNSLDAPGARTRTVPPEWVEGITVPEGIEDLPPAWHLEAILAWFDQYGIEFFEPLQIWHVPQLHELFVRELGREPRPVVLLHPARRAIHAIRARVAATGRRQRSELGTRRT